MASEIDWNSYEWIHSDMAHMRDIMAGRFTDEDDEQKEDDE